MSNVLTPPPGMSGAVHNYGQRLKHFKETYDIPPSLFDEPDHIVFKSIDTVDFADTVRGIKPFAEKEKLAFAQINWRFLAAAQIIVPMALWESKLVDWVEVMEPRETEGHEYSGLEYAEFYYPDIRQAEILLNSHQVQARSFYDEKRNWSWLNVPINDKGQEVRFSDTKLVEVVQSEIEDGTARLI
jgi:hypothetical protein